MKGKYLKSNEIGLLQQRCYLGPFDATARSLDAGYFIQSFTKKRPKSVWYRANKEKVAELPDVARWHTLSNAQSNL
ncbi:YdeI/OmpD-associated family protein [Dawidia soli]|uniref:Uncharacterized protein n=1 Tax=Dawidia soli TaxID=2782352 RepID=A0AAP2D6Z9_9BACT|nr:hypothetical protein [Dawidia soli]MBT1686282.1 hypothetical protein [Dawidia soli]